MSEIGGVPPLRRSLGLLETAGISVAMMAPTAAMALNGALAATYAGSAVPLAFVLAFATIGCVAFAFVTFARTYATPGSVGEFNARGLGPFAGRLSMWALLLVYVLFTAGSAAECGAFAMAALDNARVPLGWLGIALVALGSCAYYGTRPARTASRLMLVLEGLSVTAIVVLASVILVRGGAAGLSAAPFLPSASGPSGLGLATVFALLSFAGFEGAAVLGAESLEPRRTIPRALIASVAASGLLYVFVAYAQTIGFGTDARGSAAFAASPAPLGALALRYTNATTAAGISAGAAVSAFAATLASATAAARLVYTFARDGRLPVQLARVPAGSGTPGVAFGAVIAVATLLVVALAIAHLSGTDAFAACGTIAVIALVVVYAAVQVAALRLFGRDWNGMQRAVPVVALACLAATFVANVVPVPAGYAATYPYLVVIWLALGCAVLRGERLSRNRT